jgi:hypothetical protein
MTYHNKCTTPHTLIDIGSSHAGMNSKKMKEEKGQKEIFIVILPLPIYLLTHR